MSVEKIVAMAAENNPLKLKEAFEEEVNARIARALEEKYKKMAKESEDEDDEDDEEDDEDELNELSFEEIKSFYVAYKVITEWGIPLALMATIVAGLGISSAVKLIKQGKNAVVNKYKEIKGTVDSTAVSNAAKKLKSAAKKNEEMSELDEDEMEEKMVNPGLEKHAAKKK